MSSGLSFEDVLELSSSKKPVYVVCCWMNQFFARPARIVGWSSHGPGHEPEIIVEIDGIGEMLHVLSQEIYTDPKECQEAANISQKKYGRVSISQQEYDDLKAIKEEYEALQKGESQC